MVVRNENDYRLLSSVDSTTEQCRSLRHTLSRAVHGVDGHQRRALVKQRMSDVDGRWSNATIFRQRCSPQQPMAGGYVVTDGDGFRVVTVLPSGVGLAGGPVALR